MRALQALGEVVAVTGDGVNDVPALQAADIGIAMGERGTRSAREVAAIVLLDDNFRTIVRAIREGRQLFRNLQLSFLYVLVFHVPFVASALLIPLAGYPLLYLPVHIVWVELMIHPTALLVFQELPAGPLERVSRRRAARFFSGREWAVIGLLGALLAVLVGSGYVWSAGEPGGIEQEAHAEAVAKTLETPDGRPLLPRVPAVLRLKRRGGGRGDGERENQSARAANGRSPQPPRASRTAAPRAV